jgi:hypothetical protein
MRSRILSGRLSPLPEARQHGKARIQFHPFSITGDIEQRHSCIHQAIGDNAPFISRPVSQIAIHKMDFIDSDSNKLFARDQSHLESWEIRESFDSQGRYIDIEWQTCRSAKIHQLSWLIVGEIGEPPKPVMYRHRIRAAADKNIPSIIQANDGKEGAAKKQLPDHQMTRRNDMSNEKTDTQQAAQHSPKQHAPKDPGCGLGKYQKDYAADCPDVNKLADCVLEEHCNKTFTIKSSKSCPSCCEADVPDLDPCLSISWGDGSHDCMETEDLETLCITAWNPYTNVIFRDVTIEFAVVDPNDVLPSGDQAIQIVPDRKICFGDLDACELKGDETRVTREVTLTTNGAKEGHYNIYIGACFSVEIPDQGTVQSFPIKLSRS